MSGHTLDGDGEPQHPLVRPDHLQVGRLGDHGRISVQVGSQVVGAPHQVLLVDRAGVYHGVGRLPTRVHEPLHRVHHRHAAGLGVARAAPVHQAVPDVGLVRRDAHHLHRSGVHVALEDGDLVGILPLQRRDEVAAARQHLRRLAGQAQVAEEAVEVIHHPDLAPAAPGQAGVYALDGHQILQRGQHLVVTAFPI